MSEELASRPARPATTSPAWRRTFAVLAGVLVLVVLAQFFLAATGAFSSDPNDTAFAPHKALGYVAFLVPVAMAAVAAAGRLPGRLTGLSALVAGLVTVQVIVAKIAEALGDAGAAGPLVFGLHALAGVAIAALTGVIARRAVYSITHG